MNIKRFLVDFAIMFAIVLVVNVAVSFLYGLVVHGSGNVEWENGIAIAIALGIVLPLVRRQEKEQGVK